MLWILFIVSIVAIILGICFIIADSDAAGPVMGIGIVVFAIVGVSLLIAGGCYNSTKLTADRQIEVLEENNREVLQSIEPLINKYLTYETTSYSRLKVDTPAVIALTSLYPELKGDEFVMTQISIILSNNKEIKDLKLAKARLNAYKFWIWQGE